MWIPNFTFDHLGLHLLIISNHYQQSNPKTVFKIFILIIFFAIKIYEILN